MFITESKVNGIKVIELNGSIVTNSDEFNQDLKELTENERKVLVDCSLLSYINSGGLRVFLSTLKDCRTHDTQFKICGLTPEVKNIFTISGFIDLFEHFDDQETALASFA
jgi:anti-sigma B factor antagonist